ncbi:hypothetical protein BASA61_002947 [Batrachochytrium salamandrivorans]|nr:hypothetical protein BASA62_006075 [Batrachochytrium salamandrivorans]KAH6598177.1 hypothetical protein BASA61_002947 [Batrachochytrium salamandrivorans]
MKFKVLVAIAMVITSVNTTVLTKFVDCLNCNTNQAKTAVYEPIIYTPDESRYSGHTKKEQDDDSNDDDTDSADDEDGDGDGPAKKRITPPVYA